jgi:hypothetical protein
MSFASIRRIDRGAARQAFGHIFTPEAVTLISVGPGPLADVLPSLESAFGDWRSDTPAWPERSHPPATFPESMTVLFLAEPGASQTAIRLSRPAPGLDDAGVAEAATVARLLGNDFNSRLNTVIREEKGYTYGTAANIGAIARSGSALYTEMTVEAEHTGEALADIFAGFGSLVTAPPGQDEVMRTVTAYQTAIAGMAETGGGLFGMILAQTGNAASLEAEYQRHLEVIDVSLAAVQREAAGLAGLENAVVVLVGDPDIVLPQLTAMGLDVTILPREVP